MEELEAELGKLDNEQLRGELIKGGEDAGPVTSTTRNVFISRLAKKLAVAGPQHLADQPTVNQGGSSDCESEAALNSTASSHQSASKSLLSKKKGMDEDPGEAAAYYVVVREALQDASSQDSNVDNSEVRIFYDQKEALAFMKQKAGSRLKVFHSRCEVQEFVTQQCSAVTHHNPAPEHKPKEPNSENLALAAEKSLFKGPKTCELVQFRKLIEKGDLERVKGTVWDNPRYLVSSADTPVILHEGMRHNAVHIAAKSNQATVCDYILETVQNLEFTKLLYSNSLDTKESQLRRVDYLLDLYLNSPDKGSAETPLHIACKMGHSAVVQSLVTFSTTDRTRINKYKEKAEDIICTRFKGNNATAVKEEIQELLKGLCLVPLLRSQDNITVPLVGQPCSPDDKRKLQAPSATPSLSATLREPRLTLSAYAGPMSPSKARDFQKQWLNPRCLKDSSDSREITSARRGDAEKGYERIGRKLAKKLQVPWSEYWQFLGVFADFSTLEGLHKLEVHLSQQQTRLLIRAALDQDSPEGSSVDPSSDESPLDSGTDLSPSDSDADAYFSCEEDAAVPSASPNQNQSHSEHSGDLAGEEDERDEFSDSVDHFFESQGFMFGQKLQLKPSNTDLAREREEKKANTDSFSDVSVAENSCDEPESPWSYREARPEIKIGVPSSKAAQVINRAESPVDGPNERTETQMQTPAKSAVTDKSFNTVIDELSNDFQAKLILSPEGNVVRSRKLRLAPDLGVCLEKSVTQALHGLGRGACPMEMVIKAKMKPTSFKADVWIKGPRDWDGSDVDEESFEDDLPSQRGEIVVRDARVVTKNWAVHRHLWRCVKPVRLSVGLLQPESVELSEQCRCVNARVVRRRKYQARETAVYIHGSCPSKTDLDVMRAMSDCQVDLTAFPAVQAWLTLVAETQQDSRNSWPSPAKVRHQHRLSQLHNQSAAASPFPISPLVQQGTVTSTPLSHPPVSALTPERPLLGTPRAWLFKSPT